MLELIALAFAAVVGLGILVGIVGLVILPVFLVLGVVGFGLRLLAGAFGLVVAVAAGFLFLPFVAIAGGLLMLKLLVAGLPLLLLAGLVALLVALTRRREPDSRATARATAAVPGSAGRSAG